jgi:hypothetical protein
MGNAPHRILDVAMGEDLCLVRDDNAPRNLATLVKISLGLLGEDTIRKIVINAKRHGAAWDSGCLKHLHTRRLVRSSWFAVLRAFGLVRHVCGILCINLI